jgi:hypothetical protein
MYTSILLVALTGVAPNADAAKAPKWSLDYAAASKQAAQEKKPLAVFLAPGEGAYQKLGHEGGIGSEAEGLLAEKYVCVHVDTTTSKGKELARAFAIPEGLGIVISDRTGEKQTFRHEGDLDRAVLVSYLTRYGDPNYVFVETESNPGRAGHGAAASCSGGSCGTCGVGSCSGGSCSSGHRSRGHRSGRSCSSGSCSGGRRHR